MKSLVDPFSKPGHVIRRLQQYAVLIFHEETAEFDLTPTQYVTLQVVEHRPGIDQVTLCELTAIDRSMTARIVEALSRRGLIDKALRLLETIEPSADRAQAKILAPLRPAERRQLMQLVRRLLEGYAKQYGKGRG